ncbi:hypothetical protein COU37_03595 [Candidatus Micrarchaeota archaeon CG10_big_fil_rev_8_21_14_0_10_45_29]|nr:MAG: hypothetical protein COU37_03595 [Candidatus Micrarchaeota archaeon CG10_big_fil_rev_8_21_14_0_10_45_29]
MRDMQQPELSSEVDGIINLLRSNPDKKFALQKLSLLTGLRPLFLKKWISVLEDMGMVKVAYSMSDEQVYWANSSATVDSEKVQISRKRAGTSPLRAGRKTLKRYCKQDIGGLLADISEKREQIIKLERRQELLVGRKVADGTMQSMLNLQIARKKGELAHLLAEAKKIISAGQ